MCEHGCVCERACSRCRCCNEVGNKMETQPVCAVEEEGGRDGERGRGRERGEGGGGEGGRERGERGERESEGEGERGREGEGEREGGREGERERGREGERERGRGRGRGGGGGGEGGRGGGGEGGRERADKDRLGECVHEEGSCVLRMKILRYGIPFGLCKVTIICRYICRGFGILCILLVLNFMPASQLMVFMMVCSLY